MKDRFYKTDKQLVDDCVETFLWASDSAFAQSRGEAVGFDGLDAEGASQAARRAWSSLQRAKLFCFGPERWKALYDAADRYVTESLAGLKHDGSSRVNLTSGDVALGDNKRLLDEVMAAVEKGNGSLGPNIDGVRSAMRGGDGLGPGYLEMKGLYDLATEQGHHEVAAMAASQLLDVWTQPVSEDYEKLVAAHEDYGVRWPFPEPLPFETCFFSFGSKLDLTFSPGALHMRVRPESLRNIDVHRVYLIGYLVAWEGGNPFVFTVLGFDTFNEDGKVFVGEDGTTALGSSGEVTVGLAKTYDDGEWQQPMSMDPWILSMLIRAINEHKQIVTSHGLSLASRMAKKAAQKRACRELSLPAPFYVVDLKDEFIATPGKPKKTSSGRPIEWSHRWDVRGHECVRVERGQMPLVPKEIEKLKKRGYRIYEGMSLVADDAARLLKRGVRAPGPQEWIAVLSYWRDSFVKGPEEKPYVPAARVEAS